MDKNKQRRPAIVNNSTLKAVHDDDLERLLMSLGCYDDVCGGRCTCFFCKATVSLENIGSIFPNKGKIEFSCNTESCLSKLIKYGGEFNDG